MKIRKLEPQPPPPVRAKLPKGYNGNIDLHNRPKYKNPDGSISTVYSIGVNIDGQEILLPTIANKNGKAIKLTEQQAIDLYKTTGKNLGKFKTPQESNAMAELIHKHQQKYYNLK
jgi:hypothetical protein